MKWVFFYHSLLSDWNHGNAHFLRGIASELMARGEDVDVWESRDSWSLRNLTAEHGEKPLVQFRAAYPGLKSARYDPGEFESDLDGMLEGADMVMAHEWNAPELVEKLGRHRARHSHYRLLFHDTHHRMSTEKKAMERYDLSAFDGVLAYGRVLRDLYLKRGKVRKGRAWTWHEAADTRHFYPRKRKQWEGDVVWVGNWGDEERTEELREFLILPVRELGLKARVYGVRYPSAAREELAEAGIEYGGWLPNFEVPEVFSRFKATLHIPRRPYARALPGIPTIRVFEALACGIPLVSAPWEDAEGLFRQDRDYRRARNGAEMRRELERLMEREEEREELAEAGWETIQARHTCEHRADELMEVAARLGKGGGG